MPSSPIRKDDSLDAQEDDDDVLLELEDDSGFPLFSRPVQRQKWGEPQHIPHTNWGDHFLDLFYVAAAYNLGNLIRFDLTNRAVLYFCGCFFPILQLWTHKLYYDSRFFTQNDVWHICYELAVLLALASAALYIRPVAILEDTQEHVDMFAFCLAVLCGNILALGRIVEVYLFVEDGEEDEGGKLRPVHRAMRRDAAYLIVPMAFFVAAAIVAGRDYYGDHPTTTLEESSYPDDEPHRALAGADDSKSYNHSFRNDTPIWLMCAGSLFSQLYLVLMATVLLPRGGRHKEVSVPMNIGFAIHRYGDWAMLMLGETVLSLLIVQVSDGGTDYYTTFYAGVLACTLLQILHFQSQPHNADDHALRRTKEAAITFTILMQVYSASLIVLGASFKMLLYEFMYESGYSRRLSTAERWLAGSSANNKAKEYDDRSHRIAHFFCAALTLVFFCSDAMIVVHRGLTDRLGRCRITQSRTITSILLVALRLGILVFTATLSLYLDESDSVALVGLGCIVCQLVLRLVGGVYFQNDDHHEAGMDGEDDKWPNRTHAAVASPSKASQTHE